MFGKKIKTEIKVEGMHCNHCAGKVETAIKEIDGVKSVKVDLDTKTVEITSSVELDRALLIGAVQKAGFTMAE